MNLQEIYDRVYSVLNKDQFGNTYNPDRFNTDISFCNIDIFNKEYGLTEEYRKGEPSARVSHEVSQKITDDLSVFKVNLGGPDLPPLNVDINGIANIPSNYFHYSSLNSFYQGKCGMNTVDIDVLTDQQYSSRLSSSFLNKEKYPYCNFQSGYIRFMPKNIGQVNFVYLRKPNTPFYDYYINNLEVVIYMPPGTSKTLLPGEVYRTGATSGTFLSQSVELEWPETLHTTFVNYLVSYVADNLRSSFLKQSSESKKQQGV